MHNSRRGRWSVRAWAVRLLYRACREENTSHARARQLLRAWLSPHQKIQFEAMASLTSSAVTAGSDIASGEEQQRISTSLMETANLVRDGALSLQAPWLKGTSCSRRK